jgi:hypothetical protein
VTLFVFLLFCVTFFFYVTLFFLDFVSLFNHFLRLCVPLFCSPPVTLFVLIPFAFRFLSLISFVFPACFSVSLFRSFLFLPLWPLFACLTFN